MKLGKNGKNRLEIKEKAEILTKENFQKRGNQLKRGTLTADSRMKSSPILGNPPNVSLTRGRQFQSSPIGQVNHGIGNTG